MRRPRTSIAAVFAWPLAVAVASGGGLAAGLAGDGAWDWAAWVGLAVPVAIGATALLGVTGKRA